MMKRGILEICSVFVIIILISVTACVAPPKSTGTGAQTTTTSRAATTGSGASEVTTGETTPIYVTFETPYGATPQKTAVPTATTAPPEEWVEIYRSTSPYGYNTTAFSYDLKNPPMMINVSLVPINVSGTKVIVKQKGTEITETSVSYDYYSPYSWFEVTVRNKDTGKILLQDGFGNSYGKQYSTEVNQTMKVLEPGNLHIEMNGNQITAAVDMRVKKEGNINSTASS